MPKRTSTPRYEQINQAFVKRLGKVLPGFKDLEERLQYPLADMIINAESRHRAHSVHEGYATFEAAKLDEKFGRGEFDLFNKKLRIFEIIEDEIGRHAYSFRKGYTKAYRLNEDVLKIKEDYLKGAKYRRSILRNLAGEVSPLPANALDSRRKDTIGMDGKVKPGQPKVGFKVKVLAAVPVNRGELLKLILELEKICFSLERKQYQENLFYPRPDLNKVKRLWSRATQILDIANSTNAGMNGALCHRYEQSGSGRWYGQGTNLQNTNSVIRMAALHGLYDYDIENCHYAILNQMAAGYGYQCRAIRTYINRKSVIRQGIADRIGISVDQAKRCLIALVYGAKFSLREDEEGEPLDAIAKILGDRQLAEQLFNRRIFIALRDDIANARKVILAKHQPNRKGFLVNAMGLSMEAGRKDTRQLLAHLLQGVEALALDAMVSLYPDKIVLLQHDGFTATRELDSAKLLTAIKDKTGYDLEVSTKGRISIPIDDALAKVPALSDEPMRIYQVDFQTEHPANPISMRVSTNKPSMPC